MKKIICVLISLFSFSTAFASWTVIDSFTPVQCNDWGWVYGNSRTVWKNPCSPLSVKAGTKVLTVDTKNVCPENEVAWYVHRLNTLELVRCTTIVQFAK